MKQQKSILTIFLILQIIGKSYACFCVGADIKTENFKGYDEVFIGKVLEIKRFEVKEQFDNGDEFTFVGTETTFEISKKWKGNKNRIIKIFQDGSSCSYQFMIDGYNFLVTANPRPFTNKVIKKEMQGFYLMTGVCDLNISQFDKENFEKAVEKLNSLFPNKIELKDEQSNWANWLIGMTLILIAVLVLKKYK